jgi:serine phosphatase RsbU (regulator of sigma subunit)
MKLRTQLVLAFLLLAIVPLTGIVLYSYYSSLQAVRHASETEARRLAGEMDGRMASIRDELGRGVQRMSDVSPQDLLTAARSRQQGTADPMLGRMVRGFGEAAPFIQSFEFVPAPPAPAEAPRAPQPMDRMVIDVPQALREARREVEASPGKDPLALQAIDQAIQSLGASPPRAPDPPVALDAEALQREIRKSVEERLAAAQERRAQAQATERAELAETAEQVEVRERAQATERIEVAERAKADRAVLGRELEVPVREGGEIVGTIKARVRGDELLWRVLARTRAGEGEVPFAIDAQGKLHTVNAADRAKIQKLPLALSVHRHAGSVRWILGDWVVATKQDPESHLVFGIARPVPLAEVRRTAARNFGYGLGMIGFALLGILPLSARVTRNLKLVTDGAERIARGDLDTRVPVRSGDEFGKLALTFNRMAEDLKAHQGQLLEQERLRQQGETEQALLRTEYDRKSGELEEARRFQLSLLPKDLPEHPGFAIAVSMRTATEVGGDYYDFHLGEDGALTAAVGDATGHGARAGTMVTAVKSLFSAFAGQRGPRELLDEAARAVRRMELGRMAMGLTVARLRGGTLVLSAAGMPPVLVYRGGSGGVEEIALPGMPLGGFAFDFEERRLELAPGDAILMMTDGLPELANAEGDPLGYPRVRALFEELGGRSPEEILAGLNRAAEAWTGGEPPKDDVTLVAIRVV